MRLIEQLGQALIRIMKLKEAEQFNAAQIEINLAGKMLLGLDMELLRALSDEEIISLLKPTGELDSGKCLMAAELLKEEADIQERQGQLQESAASYAVSLSLFLEAALTNKQVRSTEYIEKIDFICGKLTDFHLPANIKLKQFRYCELIGELARAEDCLYELIESDSADYIETGIKFYKRLLQLDDAELARGNLPRDEVKEGLQALNCL